MKLPFLLNSAARASSAGELDSVFSKLLKAIPHLEGVQVSNILNVLSKKDVEHRKESWLRVSAQLLSTNAKQWARGGIHRQGGAGNQLNNQKPLQQDTPSTILTSINATNASSSNQNDNECSFSRRITGLPSVLANYDIRDVIIILNAFSKVGVMPPELMQAVIRIVMLHLNRLGSQELSKMLHTMGKHGMLDDVNAVLKKHRRGIEECITDERDYSMALRVVMLNQDKLKDSDALNVLVGVIDNKCKEMSDKSLAILVNSIGRYGRDERGMMPLLAPLIIKRLRSGGFDPMSISQMANGVARVSFLNVQLMDEIARRVVENIELFSTRCKVTILNAFHKLRYFDSKLFDAVVTDLTSSNADMTPQCIANTISATAHFNKKMRAESVIGLYKALCHRISHFESLQSFTMQNQVNILNGLSKVGIEDHKLYNRFGNNILNTSEHLKPIDVAIVLNAFSRAGMVHGIVLRLCQNIGDYLSGMKVQELTCSLNSINGLRKCSNSLQREIDDTTWTSAMNAIANHMMKEADSISDFRPLDIRLSIVSLAESSIVNEPLYSMLLDCLASKMKLASMWDLVCVFSGLHKVGYAVNSRLLDAVEASLECIAPGKGRGHNDANALRDIIQRMSLNHSLIEKLAEYV
ncbi:hypothetical protein, conserved [Babesia bigemina]|uniref:RNA-editing substrate-binding complex 6 protein domain-containing protein n=1 Tax=Babesia bigemina TaxID=5866 RepID=A0A061D6E5_BABBI|nr:hypothetical protein, conserved [Babesia bigemina]CDR96256.1 hypothetical protein, conserved [Babesia bigemina]|eukprot:XP_012768442.1 hypothetical protein, conserved [Babesia bigemina]